MDLEKLREPRSFGAWLHSVAAKLARSELRRRRFTQEPLHERERRSAPIVDASPGPEELHEATARTAGWQHRPGAAVVLREARGERVLPVFVGLTDALSFWRSAAGWDPPRPFTHDLMGRLLEGSGLRVERASILLLADNVFYGEVVLAGEQDDEGWYRHVDARPSDAVAPAVRAGAPIRVSEGLFEEDGFRSKEEFMERWGKELRLK